MKLKVLSSLEKIFPDIEPTATEYKIFSLLKNECLSFQIAFCAESDEKIMLSLDGLPDEMYSVFAVKDVPVGLAAFDWSDDFYLSKDPGLYPDILEPVNYINAKSGKWYSFWIEIHPDGKISGKQNISITLNDESVNVEINIINVSIPKQTLIHTNWFHCDAICDYYHVEPFSDEFYRIFKNFAGTAAKHGMNCILTPLFTPALDTAVGGERTTVQLIDIVRKGSKYYFNFKKLREWVKICQSLGIEYFEMCHFFTQWGAKHAPKIMAKDSKGRLKQIFGWETRTSSKEYDEFLRQFSIKLKKFIYDNNLENNVLFHISDEPSANHLKTYNKRADLMKEIFGDFPVMDALSDYCFYEKGYVDIPVPEENSIDEFYGKVDNLWTYYCCGQGNKTEPNRFIAMPSIRNRVLGVLMYKYNVKGFLQWGYNFYNSQYSLKNIDPYKITDADGHFPSGDSFVVYPGVNGETVSSLRLKVFYEGFQDYALLQLLENKIGRNEVLKLIGDINFNNYPHDNEWLLELRNKVNNLI